MQTTGTETKTAGDLLAAWRATGGAMDRVGARSEAAGDDELGASAPTMTLTPACVGDDGLQASGPSVAPNPPLCMGDDGLQATGG